MTLLLFVIAVIFYFFKALISGYNLAPTLSARTMCLSFGDFKTELRINAFYGAVHNPCSASAATKKCAPLRGFAFFCCGKTFAM